MARKIPKIAVILAYIHLIFSLSFFVSLEIYVLIWGTNKEGYIPMILLIPMTVLLAIDYPISYAMEIWGGHLSYLGATYYNLVIAASIIVIGTIMWFGIGILLHNLFGLFKEK